MKSAATYIQLFCYYSTFIQANVSQLKSFRDQFDTTMFCVVVYTFMITVDITTE